jgi:hypothetical protein
MIFLSKSQAIKELQKKLRLLYDDNENGGSSRWLVSPNSAESILKAFVEEIYDNIADRHITDSDFRNNLLR